MYYTLNRCLPRRHLKVGPPGKARKCRLCKDLVPWYFQACRSDIDNFSSSWSNPTRPTTPGSTRPATQRDDHGQPLAFSILSPLLPITHHAHNLNMSFGGQTPTIIVLKEGGLPLHSPPLKLFPSTCVHRKTSRLTSSHHRHRHLPRQAPDHFQHQRLPGRPDHDKIHSWAIWR